jgi:DNA-binding transcriptional MerR regulator
MTSEERRHKIQEIYDSTSSSVRVGTGTKLKYQGEVQDFAVYKVPIEFLIFNVDNGRIGTSVQSYFAERGALNPEDEADSKTIQGFLYDSAVDRNKQTEKSLAENGQLEPGIITMDGVIVDGNRRATLLRRISESTGNQYTQSQKDRCRYFLTRILPANAEPAEILRLETTYQMGSDSKVDYNPLEKYLHARILKQHGFSLKQIAEYMALESANKVQEYLEVMDLLDEYLKNYGYDKIYTQLPKGIEDPLIRLNATLKKVRSGRISWITSDRIEEVVADLKAVMFDYLRLDKFSQQDIRIISAGSDNFLLNERVWDAFITDYWDFMNGVEDEQSVDECIQNATSAEDSKRLLRQRDEKWKKQVSEKLVENFNDKKNIIDSKNEKQKPASLLKRALNALAEIDESTLSTASDLDVVRARISEVLDRMKVLSDAVNS